MTPGTAANTIEIRQLTDVLQCKLHEHFQCNGKTAQTTHQRIRSIRAPEASRIRSIPHLKLLPSEASAPKLLRSVS